MTDMVTRVAGMSDVGIPISACNAGNQELAEAIKRAIERYDALTPEQKAEHDRKQRESFVRGMMPTGDPQFD